MAELLEQYAEVAGHDAVDYLRQLASSLAGAKVVHVNSTREGGGVAEILTKLVPLMRAVGIDAHWEVITGEADYFRCTKSFHNALQGETVPVPESLLHSYERTNAENAETLRDKLEDADFVVVHDPQPAALLEHFPRRKGKWVWRCHIDASRPDRRVWRFLRTWVERYDASVFSLAEFARRLSHPQYLIAPSIDPLGPKNRDLPASEVSAVHDRFGLKPDVPLLLQVSRYDRFKDPVGVIAAYRLVRALIPVQLVLAGGGAADDPEGAAMLAEVKEAAEGDPDVHVLLLPSDAHETINALQRAADVVLQKSLKEGFGLTVTEALWKGKPVIGGDVGGIRLQLVNHYTGFLVRTPEGAALRIRYLLHRRDVREAMGHRARRFVRENYLITRHLRDYLALLVGLERGGERIEVGG